jgi:hypothetical protein
MSRLATARATLAKAFDVPFRQRRDALEIHTFYAPYHDDAIVTWLDGEMEDADARQFEQALRNDEQLSGHCRTDGKPSGL